MSDEIPNQNSRHHRFASTRWSVVRQVGDADSTQSRIALQQLCETYWFPLYSFARNQGYQADVAADLTQGFFADLLQREDLKSVRPELGKFRSFLLASLKHFIANHWEKENAQKRGGNKIILSIDFRAGHSRYCANDTAGTNKQTAEDEFDRQWALELLEITQNELAADYARRGNAMQFDRLKIFLAGKSDEAKIADVAGELDMTEVAAKVAIHRMRRKFGDKLRELIAQTVSSAEEVEDEIRQMFEILRK